MKETAPPRAGKGSSMKLAFCSLLLIMSACSCAMKDLVKSPEVKLDQVRVENIELQTADLIFDLKVFNPNGLDLKIDSVDYKLVLNDKEFADGRVNEIAKLPAGKTIAVPIPIKVEFRKVFDSLFSALQKPETEYKITGKARLGPITVPFDKVGKLNWTE